MEINEKVDKLQEHVNRIGENLEDFKKTNVLFLKKKIELLQEEIIQMEKF